MVITESKSAFEEWNNLPSPPRTFHPDREEKEKFTGSIGHNQSSGSSFSNTLGEGNVDWEASHSEKYWDGDSKSAHATDINIIARRLHADLQ